MQEERLNEHFWPRNPLRRLLVEMGQRGAEISAEVAEYLKLDELRTAAAV
jgi:hypothetical protein